MFSPDQLASLRQCFGDDASFGRALELLESWEGDPALDRRVIESSPDHISVVGKDHTYQYVNPSYEVAHGTDRSEIVGRHVSEVLGRGLYEDPVRGMLDECLSGKEVHFEGWFEFARIGRRYMRVTYAPLLDASQQTAGVLVVSRDVTTLVEAVEALRLSEDRYRSLFEQAADGIGVVAEDGTIIDLNPSFCHMLASTRDEVVGRQIGEFMDREELAKAPLRIQEIVAGSPLVGERFLVDKRGRRLQVELSSCRLANGHVLGLAREIGERKALEAELRQAQKLEVMGQLAGGIAHDFNNILTVILMLCDVLRSSDVTAEARDRVLDDLGMSALKAATLTRQLLAFSRRQIASPRPVDLAGSVRESSSMMRRLIDENVELAFAYPSDPAWVMVDPGQVEQILLNLLVNARDAMPDGGRAWVEVSTGEAPDATQAAHSDSGSFVRLTVTDTGPGIDPDVLPRVFEPFFTTKPVGRGTGMGLATVYGIVRQNGGSITVTSEPGEGARFEVHLPELEAGPTTRAALAETIVRPGTETILLVEDERAVREAIAEALRDQGYRVLLAEDGARGLEIAEGASIDMLITDMIMPRMGGAELTRRVRAIHPTAKVLLISGHSEPVDDPVVHREHLLPKPFTTDVLLRKVREVADGR